MLKILYQKVESEDNKQIKSIPASRIAATKIPALIEGGTLQFIFFSPFFKLDNPLCFKFNTKYNV